MHSITSSVQSRVMSTSTVLHIKAIASLSYPPAGESSCTRASVCSKPSFFKPAR